MVSLEKSDLHMYFCVQETVLELSERRKTTVFSHGGLLKNMLKVPFSPDKLKTFSLFLKVFFSALIKVFEERDSFMCPHHKLQDLYKTIISFVNLNWSYTMLYFIFLIEHNYAIFLVEHNYAIFLVEHDYAIFLVEHNYAIFLVEHNYAIFLVKHIDIFLVEHNDIFLRNVNKYSYQ